MYSYIQSSNLCKANLYKATRDYMTGTLYKLLYTSVDPLELPMLAVVGDQAAAVLVHTQLVEAQHRSEFCALSADCIDFMFGSTGAPQFKYYIVLYCIVLYY